MTSEHTIRFDSGGAELVGTVHLPETRNPPLVVGCHGLFASRQSPKQIALAEACAHRGVAYFRFDHRGCGESGGDFNSVTSLASRVDDLHQAIAAAWRYVEASSLTGLFGSSFGGATVLAYDPWQKSVRRVTYAAPCSSGAVIRSALNGIDPHSRITSALKRNLSFDLAQRLPLIKNLLVIHGQDDAVVPVEHALKIYKLAMSPKKIIVQKGGDHRMSAPHHQKAFSKAFSEWMFG